MENQLSFPMDGITLQHAGELLFDTPVTIEERNNCHETYIRSLEDFCFAYMYGEKFSHTKKFPKIQDYEPTT